MVQFAPTARLVPQVLAKTKEEALAPVTAILPIVNEAVPAFVMVTDCEPLEEPTLTEPKERLVAESVTGAAIPVPLSLIDCGEVVALSVMVNAAVNAPAAAGAKCPWMVQLAPTARLVPQLLPNTKEDAFVPVTATLVIDTEAVPVLVMVTDCEPLDAPTCVAGKERLVAESVTGAATPVPLSLIDCGEVPALSVMVTAAGRDPAAMGLKCP